MWLPTVFQSRFLLFGHVSRCGNHCLLSQVPRKVREQRSVWEFENEGYLIWGSLELGSYYLGYYIRVPYFQISEW